MFTAFLFIPTALSVSFSSSCNKTLERIGNPFSLTHEHLASNFSSFEGFKVEAASTGQVLPYDGEEYVRYVDSNGFAMTVHSAYANHHGLTLSPEQIYISIIQGLATHISLNPDSSRKPLGMKTSPGKKEDLAVEIKNMSPGQKSNDWPNVFDTFSKEIGNRVGKEVYSLLSSEYSTSTRLSKAVTAITIMDAYKAYFNYILDSKCGIPEITLEGERTDWIELINRTSKLLGKFPELDFWGKHLIPVLIQFEKSFDKKTRDTEFWTKIYNNKSSCGSSSFTGWLTVFFPYLQNDDGFIKNDKLDWKKNHDRGIEVPDLPPSVTKTSFKWVTNSGEFDMLLVAGIYGPEKHSETHMKPALGWAVIYDQKK